MRWRLPLREPFPRFSPPPDVAEADRTPMGRAFRTTTGSPGRTALASNGFSTLLWSVTFTIRPSAKVSMPVAGSKLATTPLMLTGAWPGMGAIDSVGVDAMVGGGGGAWLTRWPRAAREHAAASRSVDRSITSTRVWGRMG